MNNRPTRSNPHGIIYELIQQGAYVKVSAIDTTTGTEVSIVGDPAVGQAALKYQVAKKLRRIMKSNIMKNKKTKQASKITVKRLSDPPSGWDL